MSNNLNLTFVGPTPFSSGASPSKEKRTRSPMKYVMSFPLALHHQGQDGLQEVLPSRSGGNFFKPNNEAATPQPLLTTAQQALPYDPSSVRGEGVGGLASTQIDAYRRKQLLQDKDFPRDTLHPLLSQHQAEENAKYASFHLEVDYLANARRSGPTCGPHKPPAFLTSSGARGDEETSEGEGVDGRDDDHEVDLSATKHRAKLFSKRGDLSTVSGRRFYTEGNVQEPDQYASSIVQFANTQPTSFTAIAAKALANALHISKPSSNNQVNENGAFRLLSPEMKQVITQRNRSGRHQIEHVILNKYDLVQPPPLQPDEGVDIGTVDIPHDPFAGRHFKAVHDKPDPIDASNGPPQDREEILGGASPMHLWSKFVDEYREGENNAGDVVGKGLRVLASGCQLFFVIMETH